MTGIKGGIYYFAHPFPSAILYSYQIRLILKIPERILSNFCFSVYSGEPGNLVHLLTIVPI